eukprot:scaffold2405_cov211-Pinguiococcus_pyrenoidosus.AAC.3
MSRLWGWRVSRRFFTFSSPLEFWVRELSLLGGCGAASESAWILYRSGSRRFIKMHPQNAKEVGEGKSKAYSVEWAAPLRRKGHGIYDERSVSLLNAFGSKLAVK